MTELPSGAVTFLFSDIEGSTRLVKALRGRYAQVLAEHRHLVRAAIAGQAGHEIDTQGDAFFVAFASAKQAVLCALEAQRALAGHEWPSGASVRVRMGIHTGQAIPVEGAYTGLAVHRAARICAAATGPSAGHVGYGLAGDVDPMNLSSQIAGAMHAGQSQTIALGGGETLVLNGATLSFAVLAPIGVGGATPHG